MATSAKHILTATIIILVVVVAALAIRHTLSSDAPNGPCSHYQDLDSYNRCMYNVLDI